MARPSPTPAIGPTAGGRLMTSPAYSIDSVSVANMIRKLNFRRIAQDREGMREGWVKFQPNRTLPQGVQAAPTSDKITLIAENVRPNSERCMIAASKTTVYRYDYSSGTWSIIGSGYSPNGYRWQVDTDNGYILFNNGVDLMFSYRVEDATVTPIYELRETGIACARWMAVYNGFLMIANITEIKADELAGIMNGGSPYGVVTDLSKVNVIPYRVAWSEYGQPTNWAPAFDLTINASTDTFTLPFPSQVFVPGVTRVAVINGGANDGVLGGDDNHPDGVLVTAVAGADITLELHTDVDLTYPRNITIMRWTDQSTIVGFQDLQDDASHICGFRSFNGQIAVYFKGGVKKGRIHMGRYTGVLATPFDFGRAKYTGENVPTWGEAIAEVRGQYHVYPSNGRFYAFDGVNEPYIYKSCDDARDLLLTGIKPGDDVWAVKNPATHEIWFCRPDKTFAYDYEFDTVSEIDAEFGAAAYVQRPGWEDDWFVIAINGTLYTYGLVKGADLEIQTWLRDGVAARHQITFGLWTMGDTFNEKDLRSYVPLFGSGQTDVPLTVNLYGGFSASNPPELLLAEEIELPTKNGIIPTHYRALYFQDEIVVESDIDADVQLIGRIFERAPIASKSFVRNASA